MNPRVDLGARRIIKKKKPSIFSAEAKFHQNQQAHIYKPYSINNQVTQAIKQPVPNNLTFNKYDNANGTYGCCCSCCQCCCSYICTLVFMWIYYLGSMSFIYLGKDKKYLTCHSDYHEDNLFEPVFVKQIVLLAVLLIYCIIVCGCNAFHKTSRCLKSFLRFLFCSGILAMAAIVDMSLLDAVKVTMNNAFDNLEEGGIRILDTDDDDKEGVSCLILYAFALGSMGTNSFASFLTFILWINDIVRLVRTCKEVDGQPLDQTGNPGNAPFGSVSVQPQPVIISPMGSNVGIVSTAQMRGMSYMG